MTTLNIKLIRSELSDKLQDAQSSCELFTHMTHDQAAECLALLRLQLPEYDFVVEESWGGRLIRAYKS